MGALHRNAVPAFSETRFRSGARRFCVLASFMATVQDGIAQGQDAVYRRMGPGSRYGEVGELSLRLCVRIVCRTSENTRIRRGTDLTCGRSVRTEWFPHILSKAACKMCVQ